MIEITFTAKDLDDLRHQMAPFMRPPATLKEKLQEVAQEVVQKRAKAKPEPQPEPVEEPSVEEPQVEPEEEQEAPVDARAKAAVDLLKLKNEQLDDFVSCSRPARAPSFGSFCKSTAKAPRCFPRSTPSNSPRSREIDQERCVEPPAGLEGRSAGL